MKYQRLFETVAERTAALANARINILSYTKGNNGGMNIYTYTPNPPRNLTISCSNNTVTITATNATSIQYSLDQTPYKVYTAYTEPFTISQTITVYAKAINSDGEIEASQECVYTNPTTTPFYIEDVSGSSNTVQISKNYDTAPTLTIQKSTDGETWTSMGSTSTTAITATVPANGKLYLRCSGTAWGYFDETYGRLCHNKINTTGNCNVGGNIMSLLYGSSFTGNETTFPSGSSKTFFQLFINNTHIVNAGNLLLPATTLTDMCYMDMFNNCSSLTTTPALPATTLADSCYNDMFAGCYTLTTAPALPATTLADYCYSFMFSGCYALTTAPTLPATTLTSNCYKRMFQNCTSLTTAPVLPATTLVTNCYQQMFQGCSNLNSIKCLATDISASNCTQYWVQNVAASGTFVKDPNMSTWTTGENGIPTGWTIKNAGSIELSQNLNVATIKLTNLDTGTGYYTINGGSHIPLSEGTTTIPITQAMNSQTLLVYGEFDSEPDQQTLTLSWTDYSPAVTITETNNYVTITSPTADSITYRLGSSGEYTTYTTPVYIASDTTIYVIATKTVSSVTYTTNESQAVTHTVIPPSNLVITCSRNTVTITADNTTTLEYNTNGSSTYTTYTTPFAITETVTVYARATNADGSITASQECVYDTGLYTPFYIENLSGSSNTISIKKYTTNAPTLTIQKSTDGTTWENMGTTSTGNLSATIPSNGKLYLRCSTNSWATSTTYYNYFSSASGNFGIGGNIMSLLYGSNFTGNETTFPSNTSYIFNGLFKENTYLVSTYYLRLPATTLFNYSYSNMFYQCTSLRTTPPILPATTLAQYCYYYMFYNCPSLTTAPELPATTLANYCYYYMFSGCTSLRTAPALPATTLAQYCYSGMFQNCHALTATPELPATTLAQYCYYNMFELCTSLRTALALPATTLARSCYLGMFESCSALTIAPALPATTLADYCYGSMFSYCTALTTAPELPATTLAQHCYESMFRDCRALTTAPALPATTLANYCYTNMFYECNNLNYIRCLATNISASSCTYSWVTYVAATGTFVKNSNMSSWTTGANGIPSGWTILDSKGIYLSQALNVATIEIDEIDTGTGYYTINGGSHIAVGEGITTVAITQAMDGQTLFAHGEFDGEVIEKTLTLDWVDYSPSVTITETDNFVTITSATADTIQFRLGSSGEYTNYTDPVYIETNTTMYVIATRTVSNVVYTTNESQAVTHTVIPPRNLVITCSRNTVTITADNATNIEYRFNEGDSWTRYEPFEITQTVTVYAKATNFDGSITASQECVYDTGLYTPFYIENLSGSSNTISIKKYTTNAPTLTIQKSTDGTTWENMGTTSTGNLSATIPSNGKLYLRCSTNSWATSTTYYNYFSSASGNFGIGGNIMSLLYGSNFTGNETTFPSNTSYIFNGLFKENTYLVSTYYLRLPATTLFNYSYSNMFYQCTSLRTTPPILPATTLAQYCYYYMFYNCPSLTTAPELPATTLANYCYSNMFNYCRDLNYIKCLATNISATDCTYNWVNNVAATGTFVKNPNMTDWTTGVNGIPIGWTVRNPQGITLSQTLNVATIEINEIDTGTGYYTINGGSHIAVGEGITTVAITQAMDGQTLFAHGEFDGEVIEKTLTLDWVDYSPSVTITETDNFVTITSATADTIQYRLGSSGEYTTYTTPVYITSDTTIYVIATRTVSGITYTTNESQAVTHTVIPPSNLTISCSNNIVTITATNAQTIEYNTNGSSTYTTYTAPFEITETVTVYARATNVDGSITASQECVYSGYIGELISMGCKFWAPLTENDITEQLSETAPTHRAGQLTWDSTKNAYNFKTTAGGQQVLVYNIPGVNNLSSTLAYTLIADVWCVSNSGTVDFYTCGQTATSDVSVSCSTAETHRFSGFTNGSWHRLVQTVNGNTLKMYLDGTCVRTDTNTNNYKMCRPSYWTVDSMRNYTTIGNVWSSYKFEAYIKNVYLFDHELTASEINSLQYN